MQHRGPTKGSRKVSRRGRSPRNRPSRTSASSSNSSRRVWNRRSMTRLSTGELLDLSHCTPTPYDRAEYDTVELDKHGYGKAITACVLGVLTVALPPIIWKI